MHDEAEYHEVPKWVVGIRTQKWLQMAVKRGDWSDWESHVKMAELGRWEYFNIWKEASEKEYC